MRFALCHPASVLGLVASVLAAPVSAQDITIPNFFDPSERFARPSLAERPRLRFLTVTDFPPFSTVDAEKRLVGYHVELARAICEELEVDDRCEIQALPFAELEMALLSEEGEAILAGLAVTAQSRQRLAFTRPYFRVPARFVAKADSKLAEPIASGLQGKTVGVVDGTAHAAYLRARFSDTSLRVFANRNQALEALRKGDIEAFFADGLSLARLLATPAGRRDFRFAGGPYLDERFFGQGLSIAVRPDDLELREALNSALAALNNKGVAEELYLRHFPVGLF